MRARQPAWFGEQGHEERRNRLVLAGDGQLEDDLVVLVSDQDSAPPGLWVVAPAAAAVWYQRLVKPLFDLVAVLLLGLLLLPVIAVVALALRMSMGPGIIFRQQRIGRGGSVFTIYKFRTMRHDRRRRAVPFPGPDRRRVHKSANDPRLTPVGRFLRKWSLDELPQLCNVLRGDMSLVGPRPEMVDIVDRYQPWQHQRHRVKPGITGLWQVSARGEGMMHEHVDVDLDYVRQVSFGTDLRILVKTVPAALGHNTGY